MNRSMSMLLVLVSFRAAGAPPLCDKSSIKGARHPMVVVADKNPLHRAYLHSSVAEAAIADNPSKRYLIPGDFVFTTWSGAGSLPSSICVVYPNAQGKRTTGWIASSQLKELEAHATKLPRRASLTVATLPQRDWPRELWRQDPGLVPFHLIIKPSPSSARIEVAFDTGIQGTAELFERLEVKSATATYADPCGYTLYRMNNGIYVSSENRGINCWGNHGDSDPAGFYGVERSR